VKVSIGLVWRDLLKVPRRAGARSHWYEDLALEVTRGRAEVYSTRLLHGSDVDRWVHKPLKGMVVQPYDAVVGLGTLCGTETVLAIGQSRHLGGGLLLPHDIPINKALAQLGDPSWT
jgi:CRISPR-associated protein Csb2